MNDLTEVVFVSHWECKRCEVGGVDPGEPRCWNCGDPVFVTARSPKPAPRRAPA